MIKFRALALMYRHGKNRFEMVQVSCLYFFYSTLYGFEICEEDLPVISFFTSDYSGIPVKQAQFIIILGYNYWLIMIEPLIFWFELRYAG